MKRKIDQKDVQGFLPITPPPGFHEITGDDLEGESEYFGFEVPDYLGIEVPGVLIDAECYSLAEWTVGYANGFIDALRNDMYEEASSLKASLISCLDKLNGLANEGVVEGNVFEAVKDLVSKLEHRVEKESGESLQELQ